MTKNIVGILGKKQHGKNTVASLIQKLTPMKTIPSNWRGVLSDYSPWVQKSFAEKLKRFVSSLTGIPVEDLEKESVKNSYLPEEWNYYEAPTLKQGRISKLEYSKLSENKKEYWVERQMTVRKMLQEVGTECLRYGLHPDVHVNSLFSDYKTKNIKTEIDGHEEYVAEEPKWLIPDTRFYNEKNAIKVRGGITIKVFKPFVSYIYIDNEKWYATDLKIVGEKMIYTFSAGREAIEKEGGNINWPGPPDYPTESHNHPSETELDDYVPDELVINNGTIEDLEQKILNIVNKYNLC